MKEQNTNRHVIVVGAGPAGLTAAAQAAEEGFCVTVLEKDVQYVGGISRTVRYKDFRFDLGGHRFFSKSREVTTWWKKRLPHDFITRKRLSRLFYRGRFFDYPLRPANALWNLGVWESFLCVLSYFRARLFPIEPVRSFTDWVTNHFGARLFSIFFKVYTEKVWGMPCSEISSDWAAQRIKGLSLLKAVTTALFPQRGRGSKVVKTLIDEFDYPRFGPGMMWEKTRDDLLKIGGRVEMGREVARIRREGNRVLSLITRNAAGHGEEWMGDNFIISMPMRECVLAFDPALPPPVVEAARRLRYRDFLTVALMARRANPFPDNWLYIHDSSVRLGRIQNFNNWSPEMTPDPDVICLGLEYFCFEGDELWTMADADLIELGKTEIERLGLIKKNEVEDGAVVRVLKAYPVYGPGYREDVRIIGEALHEIANVQVIGRNGMHRYNNQDHSMMTGMLSVKNLMGDHFDLWRVNADAEYHEAGEHCA
ncbi:MAG: NAD(P)/FAD-dependent oxidoreductase [bacterium]